MAEARIAQAVRNATAQLAAAGCETPRLDAELLVAATLNVGRERLFLDGERPVDPEALDVLVARRVGHEPIAYILGRKDFRRITLAVDRRVLIPRPESELLVEVGLALPRGVRVVDIGTGSGAVALALKDERPDLEVWGVDLSADALDVARENARSLGLDVEFARADLLEGVDGPFDAVLANLPYVPVGTELEPEIEDYEPPVAVFGGPDGLGVIRRLIDQAATAPLLALEVGFDQATAVEQLLRRAGFASVEVRRDLAGHQRVLLGRR